MKKSYLICLTSLLSIATLTSCNGGGSTSSSSSSTPITPSNMINDFESESDLLRFRKSNKDVTGNFSYSLNDNATYVKNGKSSLKYEVSESAFNELYFSFYSEEQQMFDVSKLSKIDFYVFNGSNEVIEVSASIYGLTNSYLTSDFELPANDWKHVEMNVSGLFAQALASDFLGLQLDIDAPDNFVSYIDKIEATLQSSLTDDEKLIKEAIDSVNDEIGKLPASISLDNYQKVCDIYKTYQLIPDEYKVLVTSYGTLEKAINRIGLLKAEGQEFGNNHEVLGFDCFYGLGQISVEEDYEDVTSLSFDDQIKFSDSEGSVNIAFGTTLETYLSFVKPAQAYGYKNISLELYNQSEISLRVSFTLSSASTEIAPNSYAKVTVDAASFIDGMMIVRAYEDGITPILLEGSLRLGKAVGYLDNFSTIAFLLNEEEPASVKNIENDLTFSTNGSFKVKALESGEAYIRLNKKFTYLGSTDNTYLVINSSKEGEISLLGFDGSELSSKDLKQGNNVISISCSEYNNFYALSVDMEEDDELNVSAFFAYKDDYYSSAFVLAYSKTLPKLEYISNSNMIDIIKVVEKFELLTPSEIEIIKAVDENVVNDLVKYENKIIEGGDSSLLNGYISERIDIQEQNGGTPSLLISLINIPFVENNISQANKSKVKDVTSEFGLVFGQEDDYLFSGIDYPYEGSVSSELDSNYGRLFNLNITSQTTTSWIQIKFSEFHDVENYSTIEFDMYNPKETSIVGQFFNQYKGVWTLVSQFTIPTKGWLHLQLSASDIVGDINFLALKQTSPTKGLKITNLYGTSKLKEVNILNQQIAALPNVIEESDMSTKQICLSLDKMYESLDYSLKSLVENYEKLSTLVENYCVDIEIAKEVSNSSFVGFINADFEKYVGGEEKHGYYVTGRQTPDSGKEHLYIGKFTNEELAEFEEKYSGIVLYVYAPSDCESPCFFVEYEGNWKGKSVSLVAGQWNKITLSIDELYGGLTDPEKRNKGTNIYIKNQIDNLGEGNWRITHIYGLVK